jgi:hypothetical protein
MVRGSTARSGKGAWPGYSMPERLPQAAWHPLALHRWKQHSMPDPQHQCNQKLQHCGAMLPARPASLSPHSLQPRPAALQIEQHLKFSRFLAGLKGHLARREVSELVSSVMEQLALLHLLEDRLCAVVEAAQVGARGRRAGMACGTRGLVLRQHASKACHARCMAGAREMELRVVAAGAWHRMHR